MTSNRKDATQYIFNSIKRIIGYIFLISVIGYLLFLNNQESDQTSEVFIGPESVRIAALNTGDCFDLVNKGEEIGWNTYVQYRVCDLLHDGEVFYRENQLDFGDNQVSYTNLLNLFTKLVVMNFLFIRTQQSFQIAMRFNTIGIQSPSIRHKTI